MNLKVSLIIIVLASFSFGVVVERFIISSEPEDSTNVINEKAKENTITGKGRTGLNYSSSQQNNGNDRDDSKDNENPFDDQRRDPVDNIINQIDRGKRVTAAQVSSVLEQLPAGRKRREFIHRVASHWGRKDPKAALAWSESLIPSEQSIAVEEIVHGWARTDPTGAANYVTEIPKSRRSLDLVHATGHIWAEQDQQAAIDWAMSLQDPALRQRALRGSAGVWARTDPSSASAFALEIKNPYERHGVIESVARRWSRQETKESLDWALSMQGEDRNRATRAIIEEIADHDPKQAAGLLSEISASLTSDGSGGRIHRDIASEVAERWASTNPDEAAEWIADLPESQHIKREAAQRVADRWASTNPEEAAEWAVELPESDNIRRHAVERVADRWLKYDSLSASEWIAEMPIGEARDAAAGELVRNISDSDPAAAFSWANSVGNEGYQTHLMEEVIEGWHNTDPNAARSALQATDLSARQREKFKEILGPSAAPPANSETPKTE
ncbi:MAG: hypothetical protein CMP45_04270 [Rickettsiales bacterium]|nr:hypothetical protein [Rickettsiales bacterium]